MIFIAAKEAGAKLAEKTKPQPALSVYLESNRRHFPSATANYRYRASLTHFLVYVVDPQLFVGV
jgi:hypothetical protein